MKNFSTQYYISMSDIDVEYRMTPVTISLYFQDCLARFMATHNISPIDLSKHDLIWVMCGLEMNITKDLPYWMNTITTEIWFKDFSTVKENVEFQMYNKEGVFVKGNSTWVILDKNTKRPINAKEFIQDKNIPQMGKPQKLETIKIPEETHLVKTIPHKIEINDVDFNGHMSNRHYLRLCFSLLEDAGCTCIQPSNVSIQYTKEAFLDQTVQLSYYQLTTDSNKLWCNITNEQGATLCKVLIRPKQIQSKISSTSA